MAGEPKDVICCPFEKVGDKALETARILLTNLGSRMLRGLKNQVTVDEHKSLLMCILSIENEQNIRTTKGFEAHSTIAATKSENGGR